MTINNAHFEGSIIARGHATRRNGAKGTGLIITAKGRSGRFEIELWHHKGEDLATVRHFFGTGEKQEYGVTIYSGLLDCSQDRRKVKELSHE